MAFANLPELFSLRMTEMSPEAHLFLIPEGPRTHEYLDGYNLECEQWLADITKDETYPESVKTSTVYYERGDYKGRALVYRPDTDEKLPIVFHAHGGSFLFWRPEYYSLMCANIAEQGHCIVVCMDFRQNIDVLVPDMFEDVYEGILSIAAKADEIGGDAKRLAIMGDSSGGQIAAGIPQMCRDRGTLKFAHQIILAGGIGYDPVELDNGNTCASTLMGAVNVVKRGFENLEQAMNPYYSPVYDQHMELMPSTTFVVGTADYMAHEVAVYGRKLMDAGVDVNVGLFQGMPHGFYNGGCGPASRESWIYIGEQIRKHLS